MNALREQGEDARMLVLHSNTGDKNVTVAAGKWTQRWNFYRERMHIFANNGWNRRRLFLVDDGSCGLDLTKHPWVKQASVIILAWVNQAMLSIDGVERLCRLGKPVYWVMHDQWNCTAVCHYAHECERFVDGCHDCPQMGGHGERMLRRAIERKQRLYDNCDIHFVGVSNWVADGCRRSALMRNCRISVIPNAINLDKFDCDYRGRDDVPSDKTVAVLGAYRLDDPIKGLDTLIALTEHIADKRPALAERLHLLLFGAINDESLLGRLRLPYTWTGYCNDPLPLYRSAQVVLSTARYENLPTTLIEGIASGCRAVSTARGGQADIVDHRHNGFLGNTVEELADGLQWAVDNADSLTRRQLHDTMSRFDAATIARRFINMIENDKKQNTSMERKITIAIDGFSSTGKSTMARTLAKNLGYAYVDTGAMYRAVTLYALRHNMIDSEGKVDIERLEAALPEIKITLNVDPESGRSITCLDGVEVEKEIRSMEVSGAVSNIAAIAVVRHAMVAQQQAMGVDKGLVMDGRDIGTVVFPDAEMKVFVTASAEIRAQRRFDELQAKGDTTTTFEEVLANVQERDRIDTTRTEGPLRQADDALLLDNSHLTIDQQNEWLLAKAREIIAQHQ